MGNSPPSAGTVTPNITSLWAWDGTKNSWFFYSPLTTGTTDAASINGYESFGTSTLGMGVGFWVNNPASSSTSSTSSSNGSSSSSTTTSTSSSPITVSGKVIDGYISGAKVCIDLNKNGKCDANEASTLSDSNGNYTLSFPPSVPNMNLIAVINATSSKDKDDGGATISTAGGKSYTLLAPAPSSSSSNTHITPLTTLVSGLMATSGLSAQAAQSQVLLNFSQPPTLPLLNYDFTDSGSNSGSTQSQMLAKVIVSAIASAQNALTSSTSYTTSADPDQAGYTAITQIVPSALNTIIDPDSGNLKTAVSTLSSAVTSVGETSKQIANSVASSVALSTQTLGSSKSTPTASAVINGFVVVNNSNGDTYSNSTSTYNQISTSGIRAEYNRISNGSPVTSSYDLVNNVWYPNTQDGTNYDLTDSGWLPEQKGSSGVSSTNFEAKNNCFTADMTASGPTQRICLNANDVSSQLISKYIPSICTDGTPLSNCSTATFPASSYTYDVSFSYLDDRYEVWVNDGHTSLCGSLPTSKCNIGWDGYGSYSANNTNYNETNLVDFFTHLASNKTIRYIGNNSNVAFQINSFDSSTLTGVIAFYDNSSNAISNMTNASSISQFKAETTTFKIKDINGTKIAIYTNPVVFSKNNPNDFEPYGIFAAVTRQTDKMTGIWQGGFTPANYLQNISFSGAVKVVSKNVLDTYLTITQQAPFPSN